MDGAARSGDEHMFRAVFDRFRTDADAAARLWATLTVRPHRRRRGVNAASSQRQEASSVS